MFPKQRGAAAKGIITTTTTTPKSRSLTVQAEVDLVQVIWLFVLWDRHERERVVAATAKGSTSVAWARAVARAPPAAWAATIGWSRTVASRRIGSVAWAVHKARFHLFVVV